MWRPKADGSDLELHNPSAMPVWRVIVHVYSQPSGALYQVVRTQVLPPPELTNDTVHVGRTGNQMPSTDSGVDYSLEMWFRDAQGVDWHRSATGELTESPPPPDESVFPAVPGGVVTRVCVLRCP